MLLVNGAYYPYFEVLPRRYRFRILNASMSRFIKLALAVNKSLRFAHGNAGAVLLHRQRRQFRRQPDPNRPQLDEQGVAERYDIVIDFSAFRPGDSLYILNLLKQSDGRKPDGAVSLTKAFKGEEDPCVGPILEFRVVYSLKSVDDPSTTYTADSPDPSVDSSDSDWRTGRKTLTTQIPVVAPVRERVIEFGRFGDGDSRKNPGNQCIPDCGDTQNSPGRSG